MVKYANPGISMFAIILFFLVLFLPHTAFTQRSQSPAKKQISTTRNVGITIEENYGSFQPTGTRVFKWIDEDLKKVFQALDFGVGKQKEAPDISLLIKLTGVPVADMYTNVGKLYAGAVISGEFKIEVSGIIKRRKWTGKAFPPSPLSRSGNEYEKPDDAPFHHAYHYSNFMIVLAEEVEALLEIPKEKFLSVALRKASSNYKAVDQLAEMGLTAAPYLAAVMNNPDENFDARLRAVEALRKTKLNAFKVLDPLREALNDKAKHLRMSAAMAIAEISKEEGGLEDGYTKGAALVLIPYLAKNADAYDRQESISALGDLGNELAVEPLIKTLKTVQDNFFLKNRTSEALKKITGQDLGSDPQKWFKWWQQK